MTDANTAYYLQGIFWANLGLNMFKKRQKDYWSSTLTSFPSQ